MAQPRVTLGGVPIVLHAGPAGQSDSPLLAEVVVRMGAGGGTKLSHWAKAGGTISGQGWMPPGLDGLDYSAALELRLTQQESISGTGLSYTLSSAPRDDVTPWAQAMVGDDWVSAECVVVDGVATVTPVAGATLYSVQWMPVYQVFVSRPQKSLDPSQAGHSWSFTWEEV